MNLLAFAASARTGSLNRMLVAEAARLAREAGAEVDLVEFRAFEMPMYDGDREAAQGIPPGAQTLVQRLQGASGVLIATPEYNASIPGTLKNAIDWVSRAQEPAFTGKSLLLLSASPSTVGGARGLWQARIPLEVLGAFVYPDMYSLPQADHAFDGHGNLIDPQRLGRLRAMIAGYLEVTRALSSMRST